MKFNSNVVQENTHPVGFYVPSFLAEKCCHLMSEQLNTHQLVTFAAVSVIS